MAVHRSMKVFVQALGTPLVTPPGYFPEGATIRYVVSSNAGEQVACGPCAGIVAAEQGSRSVRSRHIAVILSCTPPEQEPTAVPCALCGRVLPPHRLV